MTLLELILAVTILTSITALIGATWAQARTWMDDADIAQESLTLRRVLGLLNEQWIDRRDSIVLDESQARVLASDTQIMFVTATPILHPEWPLVRAAYAIEDDPDRNAPDGGPMKLLVYSELRIMDLGTPPQSGLAPDGSSLSREITLLEACEALSFDRFIIGEEGEESDGDEDAIVARWDNFEDEDVRVHALRLAGSHETEEFTCLFVIKALR